MIFLGVLVNVAAIFVGTFLGQIIPALPAGTKETVMKVIGIAVLVLGLDMALTSSHLLIVLFSLVIGGAWGEWMRLENRLQNTGAWLEGKIGKQQGNVAKAFVTTTLIYCIGAMAVIGALDSGLRGDHHVLYTKSFLDGFIALIFSSTLGIGVLFSAIPVLLYQGSIVLLSTQIHSWFSPALIDHVIADLTATGGILIMAIGFNLMEITKIKVGNLLPAIVVAVILSCMVYAVQGHLPTFF